jgi:hypothetical protein
MHSQLNALGKQATSLGEAYTKTAADAVSKTSSGSLAAILQRLWPILGMGF